MVSVEEFILYSVVDIKFQVTRLDVLSLARAVHLHIDLDSCFETCLHFRLCDHVCEKGVCRAD